MKFVSINKTRIQIVIKVVLMMTFFSTESFLDDVNLLLNFLVPSLWRAFLQMESRHHKQRTLCRKKVISSDLHFICLESKIALKHKNNGKISRFSLFD